jgi:tetratricopeptide (TPR) repeat protein
MFRKFLFISFAVSLAVFAAAGSAFAQNAPVRGQVRLTKADGTVVPVAEAVVEAYRTDIGRGTMPAAKTNKRGEFSFVAFPLGHTFALAISGPGIGPKIEPNVKAGREDIVINVSEGDGKKLTEAEVREVVAAAASAPAGGGESAESKKQREEIEKKNAEIAAKNKKVEDSNKIINAAFTEGDKLFKAKEYDQAIAKFDEGINADPDYEGSVPVLQNYKGVALRERAITNFRAAAGGDAAAKTAAMEKIKPDLDAATAAFLRGLEVLKNAPAGDANAQKNAAGYKLNLLSNLLETYGISAKLVMDPAKLQGANETLEQYLAVETDEAKKQKVLLAYAANMSGAGQLAYATVAYRKVLEKTPDNLDAIAGLGLTLYSEGYSTDPPNKEALQEGLNHMQRFVDAAPDTHPLKASVKDTIEELKNTQKLAPQKTAPPRRRT